MGRNPKNHNFSHGGRQNANELLNFHFSTPAAARQDQPSNNARNHRRGNHNGRNHSRRRSALARASARQTADSSMFYLHSSAEHTFLLTRKSPSKMNPNEYSFKGSDQSVSWESVRMVQQRISLEDEVACPICLCDFVSPRISKCGHSFCLSCILRHVQTYAANNPYHPVKCPCCGIPLIVEDMRPVCFDAVHPVRLQQPLRLRKLHRQKGSSSPYLPLPGAPQHSNPHFAPTVGIDADAKYSRFNYLDPEVYHATLVAHQGELFREQKEIQSLRGPSVAQEQLYLSLAIEMVLEEQQKAQHELEDEQALMNRFAGSNTGMYQPQSLSLEFRASGEMVDAQATAVQRYRGDSIGSFKSVDTAGTSCSHNESDSSTTGVPANKPLPPSSGRKRPVRKKGRKPIHGSMYLDTDHAVHLYQAEDGQLVFLNGFNMTCLLSDFSKGPPECTDSSPEERPPLPDVIEGRVLEKELVHLTSETRKRMPFLNHIPLYTDIVFVELDLNHLLSETTKQRFKNEIAKRRKKRQSKVQAEKRADRIAKKEDQDRINERKARLQTVDPDDAFFHAALRISEAPETATENFGPVLGDHPDVDELAPDRPSSFSFSQAAQRGTASVLSSAEAFPTLGSAQAFPTLGSSNASSWGSAKTLSSSAKPTKGGTTGGTTGGTKKKKKKGEKLVLFSTGGSRGF